VTDLLKNFVFSRFGQDENAIDVAEEQWNRITAHREKEFPRLLRYYWNSHHGVTRPPRLFKEIRATVHSHEDATALLDQLELVSVLFTALKNAQDSFWNELPAARDSVREIDLFGVTQCYPLLFACWEHMRSEFVAVLRICAVISFRYITIGKLNTQPMERVYAAVAAQVRQGVVSKPAHIFQGLKSIYVSDEQFEADFASVSIPTSNNRDLVRYILLSIENHLTSGNRSFGDGGTIEHILPENPDDAWMAACPDGIADVYKLGNYTLLESGANRRVARKPIEEKKVEYAKSNYELSKRFGWNEWTRTQISDRQKWMARQAVATWRLNY